MLKTSDISTERKDEIIYGLIDILEEERELIYPAEEVSEVMTKKEMEVYCGLLLYALRCNREK